MTKEEFKKLQEGDELYVPADDDERTYSVLEKDRMGRVKMKKISYYVDVFDYQDEYFDSYDDAENYRQQLMDECTKGELDVEDIEETFDELKYAEIESETFGKPFWMHYTEVELSED